MRQLKIDSLPSSIAALGVPAFSAIHGIGIEALFIPGLFTQSFGLLLFCIALGLTIKIIYYKPDYRNTYSLALLIGILFISHTITSIYFIFCLLVLVVLNITNKNFLIKIIIALSLGTSISIFVLGPMYFFKYLIGPDTGWGNFNFFTSILTGRYFGPAIINIFAIIGFFIALIKRKRNLMALAILCVITQFLASGIVFNQLFKHRSYAYLAIYYIIFTSIFYNFLINLFPYLSKKQEKYTKIPSNIFKPILTLTFILIVLFSVIYKSNSLKKLVLLDTDFSNPRRNSFIEGFQWLHDNTPNNTIIAFDTMRSDMGSVGFILLASQINTHSDRYTLDGNYTEGTNAHNELVTQHLSDWSPNKIHTDLIRYNTSYIYTWNQDAIKNLSTNPNLFHIVYYNGIITIFQVMQHDFRYILNNNINILKFYFSPEHVYWNILNNVNNNHIVLPIAYHPNWKLYINNNYTKTNQTHDHLLTFTLPKNSIPYNIEIKFQRSLLEKTLYIISFFSLLITIFLLKRSYN